MVKSPHKLIETAAFSPPLVGWTGIEHDTRVIRISARMKCF